MQKSIVSVSQGLCGGDWTGDEGVLETPPYGGGYNGVRECVWKLTATPGFQIAFIFDTYEVRP